MFENNGVASVPSAYAEAGDLLRFLADPDIRALPPGSQGALSWAVEKLRRDRMPAAMIERVEAAALIVHQLDWALRDRDGEGKAAACRVKIAALLDQWAEPLAQPRAA